MYICEWWPGFGVEVSASGDFWQTGIKVMWEKSMWGQEKNKIENVKKKGHSKLHTTMC